MNKAAFLVDGLLEQKFVKRVCPGRPVRYINCNGDNVALDTMAKYIASLIRVFGNKYYPIIIIVDRESRAITSRDMCDILLDYLRGNENIQDDIIIAVADRMIENWILSDFEIIKSHSNYRNIQISLCDGSYGKKIINDCVKYYHETTIGVELLLKCRASVIQSNSPSFSNLFEQIKIPLKGCWWLNR